MRLTIDGRGSAIHRCRPYSYGASTEARKLSMLLNVLARDPHDARAHPGLHTAA